jgi:hypothetical protein
MKVKLTKVNYKDAKRGDEIDIPRKQAEYLLKSGLAQVVKPKPKPKTKHNKKEGE